VIRKKWQAAAIIAAMAAGSTSLFVRAAYEAKPSTDAPKKAAAADGEKKMPKKSARLVKPYSELKSLSPDQAEKIVAIHRKALDEINAIKDKEEKDILALLSDAQKAELKALDESDTVAKKAAAPKKSADKTDAPAKATPAS
jgi:hypothetical protein